MQQVQYFFFLKGITESSFTLTFIHILLFLVDPNWEKQYHGYVYVVLSEDIPK